MFQAMKKNGLILAVFACASTGLVAITQYVTADRIEQQQEAQLLKTLNHVIPPALHDNALYDACTLINDDSISHSGPMPVYVATLQGKPTAVAIEAIAPDGYNGAIKLVVGIKADGTISGTRILEQNETPGLGDKIDSRVSNWVDGFIGKFVSDDNLSSWKVRKDGGEFDQFTGATITPRAVVKSVRNTVMYFNQHKEQLFTQPHNCGGSKDE